MESIASVMKKEHENILMVIEAIEQNAQDLNDGLEFIPEFYEKFIEFQKNYTDKFHHKKEEDILFPILNKNREAKDKPEVKILVHQHILSRAHIENMEEGLESGNVRKVVANSLEYAKMIREHIIREDDDYFPFVETILSLEEKNKVLKEFNRSENSHPAGTYEKYISLAKEIRTQAGLK